MLVFGEMHLVTFIFSVVELLMLVFLLPGYMSRPQEKNQLWYLILLTLLIFYNITGGLLPNPDYTIPVYLQNIIAYGSGFLMASYFPYYFYRAFDLKLLRFHALYGVPLFLLLPFLLFFVISYSIHEDLEFSIRYGVIVPFLYSLVLLRAILKAIRTAYKENRDHHYYIEEIAVYIAVLPWSAMTLIAYFNLSQLTEAMFTNLGFLTVTAMHIFKSVQRERKEKELMAVMELVPYNPLLVANNCSRLEMTGRETDIIELVCQRLSYKEIGEKLFISERTVNTHIRNIFKKLDISSKAELIRKMNGY